MPILIVSNPDGTSQRVEIDDAQIRPLVGTRIGQTIDGSLAGMQGYSNSQAEPTRTASQ